MRRIAGAFRTTPVNLLPLLTSLPPMSVTIRKLCDSAATRLFRLPHTAEISRRLPASFFAEDDRLDPPTHHPFPRPGPNQKPQDRSNLTSLARSLDPNTERSDPYHSHNAPYALAASSPPFAGRLFFKHKPCHKDDKKSLVTEQNILVAQLSLREDSLVVFTDGSRRDCGATGYGLVGYHMNREVFKLRVPFAKKASQWDAEMYALAHASYSINRTLQSNPRITRVQMFSDASSAIQKIFDGSPHPSQTASILFRSNFLDIFTRSSAIRITVTWTPGHGGTAGMKCVDGLAKKASEMTTRGLPTLVHFTSRSAAEQDVDRMALKRWKATIESDPIKERSQSHPASLVLRPSLRPRPWFKKLSRPEMSRLTQFASGHGYTGEYYNDFVKANSTSCSSCIDLPSGKILHSRTHILKECPRYEEARSVLEGLFPRLTAPRWPIKHLFRDDAIPHLVAYLMKSGAFSKDHAPRRREPP